MKRILLISYNFSPELTGIGKYNGEMIDWLVKRGYDCSVITSYPYYPNWKIDDSYRGKRFLFSREEHRAKEGAGTLTVFRCPMYVPASPSGFKRILLELTFFISALCRMLGLLMTKKYDLVIGVAPAFHVGLLGLIYQRLKGSTFLYHVQDLQIEAARNLKMLQSKSVIRLMLFLEKVIIQNANLVSSISDEMVKKLKAKGARRVFLFPNWTNTDQFYPIGNQNAVRDELGFCASDKIVLYSGAIGEKQGLECVLFAAAAHRTDKHLKFLICGNGPYKKKLEKKSQQLHLTNVYFLPLQPYRSFNRFLNAADIHLIIQKSDASDVVMPSKLGAILAVGGLALITACPGTSLYELVRNHNIGLLINPDNQRLLNEAIGSLSADDFLTVRENARRYAEQCLSTDKVMESFERTVNGARLKGIVKRKDGMETVRSVRRSKRGYVAKAMQNELTD